MQKGQALVLILVGILIIISVAGGAYFLGKSSTPKPQPPKPVVQTPQPTPDASPVPTGTGETANWKTYTSIKYGYSIDYPADWGTAPSDQSEASFAPKKSEGVPVGISVISGKLSDQLDKRKKELKDAGYNTKIEDYKVNNVDGKKLMFNKAGQEGYDFLAEKNGYTYHLTGASEKWINIVNQMLSTFKFTL